MKSTLFILVTVGLSLVVVCPSHTTAQENSHAKSLHRAAFLNADESQLGILLETRLLEIPEVAWVEREELGAIQREIQLSAGFGSESRRDRIQLGVLLKADILIVLRDVSVVRGKDTKRAELVVCETRHGLRLFHTVANVSADMEHEASALCSLVERLLKLPISADGPIVAVPPFYSEDLQFTYDHLKLSYSRLLQEYLTQQTGVIVVSLEEADALARELRLADHNTLDRSLPFYLLGAFRNNADGENRRVQMTLTIKRGTAETDHFHSEDMSPDDVAAWLREKASEFLARLERRDNVGKLRSSEADQLLARALHFKQIGNWDEYYLLIESGLLLEPDNYWLRREGVTANFKQFRKIYFDRHATEAEARKALATYRRGTTLYEEVLRDDLKRPKKERADMRLADGIKAPFYRLNAGKNISPPTRSLFLNAWEEMRQGILRICKFNAVNRGYGFDTYMEAAVHDLPDDKKYDLILQVILDLQDFPDAKARSKKLATRYYHIQHLDNSAGVAFLERLAKSGNDDVQAAGRELLEELDKYRADKAMPPKKPSKLMLPAAVRVVLEPLELKESTTVRRDKRLKHVEGCIPIPEHGDLIWSTGLYLMERKGELIRLWYPKLLNNRVVDACYDGKFVWAVVESSNQGRRPFLLLVDLKSRKVRLITAVDGLPGADHVDTFFGLYAKFHCIAAIEPGRVVMAGDFGRTWVGFVSADLRGPVDIRIVHEARDVLLDPFDEKAWQSSTYHFTPSWMRLFNQSGRQRVLLGRGNSGGGRLGNHPLIFDIENTVVEILKRPTLAIHRQGYESFDTTKSALFACGRIDRFGTIGIVRFEFPNFEPEIIRRNTPLGAVAITEGHMHVIGRQWWTARFDGHEVTDRRFELMADELPLGERPWWLSVHHSLHYGLIVDDFAPRSLPVLEDLNQEPGSR